MFLLSAPSRATPGNPFRSLQNADLGIDPERLGARAGVRRQEGADDPEHEDANHRHCGPIGNFVVLPVTGEEDRQPSQHRTVRHSITRYRITLDVYRAEIIAGLKTQLSGEWVSQFQLHTLAFSSAHAKIRSKIT